MKSRIMFFCFVVAATLAMNAQSLIVEENFDYPVGEALTAHDWAEFSAGANPISVADGSLTYKGYLPNEGNHAVVQSVVGQSVYLPFSPRLITDAAGTGIVYTAFVIKVSAATENVSYPIAYNRSGSAIYSRICIKSSGAGFTVGIVENSSSASVVSWYDKTLNFGENYLFVLKYDKIVLESFNDVISLYINPVAGEAEPATPTLTKITAEGEAFNLRGLGLHQPTKDGDGSVTFGIDGIRVAETWDEAVKGEGGTTPPPPVVLTLPYTDNFDSYSGAATAAPDPRIVMDGWAVESPNPDDPKWFLAAKPATQFTPYSVPNTMMCSWNGDTFNDYLFTPFFNFEAGESYTLTFYRRQATAMAATTLTVDLFSEQSSTTALSLDRSFTFANTDWTETTVVFSPTITGNYCVGFKLQSEGFAGMVAIDDMSVVVGGVPQGTEPLTLPYSDNFDSYTGAATAVNYMLGQRPIMDGWVAEDANNDGHKWILSAKSMAGGISYEPYSAPNTMMCSWEQATFDDYLFTPFFNFEADKDYTLTFYRRQSDLTQAAATLTVDLFSEQSSTTALSLGRSFTFAESSWIKTEVIFRPTAAGEYCIGFKLESTATAGHVGIDDMLLEEAAEVVSEPDPELFAEENFDYPVGEALTAHDWAEFSAGANPISVGDGSLTYKGYLPNEGNHAVVQSVVGQSVYLPFSPRLITDAAGTGIVYTAFVIKVSAATENVSYPIAYNRSGTAIYSRICIKSSGAGFTVGIVENSSSASVVSWYDKTLNFGENYLFVLKYDKIAFESFNDVISLYINPVAGEAEPATPTLTKITAGGEAYNLRGLGLHQAAKEGDGSVAFGIDGIRVANTWGEAVKAAETTPEPEPTILPLPYVDNFDEYEGAAKKMEDPRNIMDGWAVKDLNPDIAEPESWFLGERNVTATYSSLSAPNTLMCSWAGSTHNDYLFTPYFHFEEGKNYTLTFYRRQLSPAMSPTKLTVDLFSAQLPASVAKSLDATFTFADPLWTKTELVITPDATGNYCIGFKVTSPGFGGVVGIDDMSLREGNPPVALVAVFPADKSIDVNVATQVSARFDHPVTIVDASKITIANATSVTASVDAENPYQLNIAHDSFEFGATYTVTIDKEAIADFAGEESITWSFTTVGSGVEVVGQSPVNNEPGIFPKHKILLEFNQTPVVLDESKITINNGVTVEGTTVEENTLYIDHTPFAKDQSYTVTIAEGAIERYSGTTFTFTTVYDGEISTETRLYGPVAGVMVLRGISENGRYLAGQSVYGAMMWDVFLNGYYPIALGASPSTSYGVSNDGHTALFVQGAGDDDLSAPSVWFEGEMTTLPHYRSGTAWCITPDGTKIGGHNQIEKSELGTFSAAPCVWTRGEDGEYTRVNYAGLPEHEFSQGMVRALSADGSRAVGRAVIRNYTKVLYEACYWNSPDEITMLYEDQNEFQTEFTSISGNGRYGGMWRSGVLPTAIFDFETGEFIDVPCANAPINGVTDDGLAVMAEGSNTSGFYSSVFDVKTNTCKRFETWISEDLESIYEIDEATKTALLNLVNTKSVRIMAISSDGQNWAIQADYEAYMLHLKKKVEGGHTSHTEIYTQVYPSLTTGNVFVKVEGTAKVNVINMQGRTLQSHDIENDATISLAGYADGIYLIQIHTDRGSATKKVVKK